MNDLEIKSVVDEFGSIEAQIKELEAKRAELKSKINKLGPGSYRGNDFVVSYSVSERATVSWKNVAEKFNPPKELISEYTKVGYVESFKLISLNN
jgi:hypothetical protein